LFDPSLVPVKEEFEVSVTQALCLPVSVTELLQACQPGSVCNINIVLLGHVKLIIWFSDTAASAKNRPLACIYHQTKINTFCTTVKKSAFKFSHLLT